MKRIIQAIFTALILLFVSAPTILPVHAAPVEIEGRIGFVENRIFYEANGGIGSYVGSPAADDGTSVILTLEETGIEKDGCVFTGWNTQPEGGGHALSVGETILLENNVVLYAQWQDEHSYVQETGGVTLVPQTGDASIYYIYTCALSVFLLVILFIVRRRISSSKV